MELVNTLSYPAGWTVGFQKDGREMIVVAAKATFTIPPSHSLPEPATEQEKLVEADVAYGKPGESATLYETDYAHFKPFCDVLVNANAHAPNGRAVRAVNVGLEVGPIRKRFRVVGDRHWDSGFLSGGITEPEPFTAIPITYDRAFGGVDSHGDSKTAAFKKNPVGVGYYPLSRGAAPERNRLPNTEELGAPVNSADAQYNPMSFGALGRNFESRLAFAGTYDDRWLRNRAPIFPDDFDSRYFQAAAADQQMPYPKGGEVVLLENLAAEPYKAFMLPEVKVVITVVPQKGRDRAIQPVVDTVLIEPDLGRFMLTFRAIIPLQRNCFELRRIVLGDGINKSLSAHSVAKPHYANIADFISAKRKRRG